LHKGARAKGRFNHKGKREMTQTYEDFSKYGKDLADTGLKSFASLSKGAQAIAAEAGEYTKKSFEAGSAAAEKIFSAKSLEKAIEIQSDFAKQSYESFVAEATKIADLYAELAKEAYKPFESIVAKAK
jgi:phasin family protein